MTNSYVTEAEMKQKDLTFHPILQTFSQPADELKENKKQ